MPRKPAEAFQRVWWLVTALAISSSIPLELWWEPWPRIAAILVWVGLAIFALAEYLGSDAQREYTGYYTGWWYYHVRSRTARWIGGLWLAADVFWRLPEPWNYIFGGALFLWLPAHYAVVNVEMRWAKTLQLPIVRLFVLGWVLLVLCLTLVEVLL